MSNPVTPININATEKESELADLEKIMDSFESEERVIGTIVKCDTDSLHGISDSPPRIMLGYMNTIPVANENCSITPDSVVQTNTGTDETAAKDNNDNTTQNTEAEGQNPHKLAGVTGKNNTSTDLTDIKVDSEAQQELAGVTLNTIVSIDITKMTDLLTKNNREMEGNTREAVIQTSEKPVTPSNYTVTPLNASAYSAHEITASSLEETAAPVGTIPAVPDSSLEDAPILPDLVTEKPQNKDIAAEQATTQEPITGTIVTPNNTSEFDFPPISSDEENIDSNGALAPLNSQEKESQLTEEEGDAVNALLSLSRSLPSNGDDDIEITKNSDVAPVPIRLSCDDVKAEITRLNLHEPNNDVPNSQSTTATTTTTTSITSKSGVVLSTCSDEAPSTPLASPTPKSSDESPGSPHGNFRLRSYGLKKKTVKSHNFPCKLCGAIKKSVQALNDHHKHNHSQVMCGTCKKLFDAPLQLAHHMYEHHEKTLKCCRCDKSFVFQSELDKHKINH